MELSADCMKKCLAVFFTDILFMLLFPHCCAKENKKSVRINVDATLVF